MVKKIASILLLVGILAGIVYLTLYKNDSYDSTNIATSDSPASIISPITLNKSALPSGWDVVDDVTDISGDRIMIRNSDSHCYTDVAKVSQSESLTQSIEQRNLATVQAIEGKGYTVQTIEGEMVHIDTDSGGMKLETLTLNISGFDNPIYQSYSYVKSGDREYKIQLSCRSEVDYPSAKEALKAIKFAPAL